MRIGSLVFSACQTCLSFLVSFGSSSACIGSSVLTPARLPHPLFSTLRWSPSAAGSSSAPNGCSYCSQSSSSCQLSSWSAVGSESTSTPPARSRRSGRWSGPTSTGSRLSTTSPPRRTTRSNSPTLPPSPPCRALPQLRPPPPTAAPSAPQRRAEGNGCLRAFSDAARNPRLLAPGPQLPTLTSTSDTHPPDGRCIPFSQTEQCARSAWRTTNLRQEWASRASRSRKSSDCSAAVMSFTKLVSTPGSRTSRDAAPCAKRRCRSRPRRARAAAKDASPPRSPSFFILVYLLWGHLPVFVRFASSVYFSCCLPRFLPSSPLPPHSRFASHITASHLRSSRRTHVSPSFTQLCPCTLMHYRLLVVYVLLGSPTAARSADAGREG